MSSDKYRDRMLLIFAESYRGQTISYWYNTDGRDFIYIDGMSTRLHHLGVVRSFVFDLSTAIRNGRNQVDANHDMIERLRRSRKSKTNRSYARG